MFRRQILFSLVALCGLSYAAPPGQVHASDHTGSPSPPPPPSGGVDVSPDSPAPVYRALSDFDFQSLVRLCLTFIITT